MLLLSYSLIRKKSSERYIGFLQLAGACAASDDAEHLAPATAVEVVVLGGGATFLLRLNGLAVAQHCTHRYTELLAVPIWLIQY